MDDMDEYIFDDDGNPIFQSVDMTYRRVEQVFADEPELKDIFHIKGDGYDVTLSLSKGAIIWKNVNPAGKKKGIFKNKNKYDDRCTVMLKDVFGAKMKMKKSANSEDGGICLGFNLHVCDLFGPNVLSERVITFEHPSESLCLRYTQKIRQYLDELNARPKRVKLFLQAHAGSRNGNSLFKNKILPMFQAADVNVECIEVQHNEHIKQEMVHTNLDDYDCMVAMGGDGTASKVADGLLTMSQKHRDLDPKPGFNPVKSRLPLGVIAIGTTNDIARSVMGTEDPVTCTLNIIIGETTPVDVCTVYSEDKFQQWGFNCQYGFAGNILSFRNRYKAVGKRGLEPAFVKALTKAKLKSYKCDIEFIPAQGPIQYKKSTVCTRGCDICWNEKLPGEHEVTQDMVQAFDPLADSHDSDTLVDLAAHEDTEWRSIKGEFMNVGIYAISGRSEMAPRGLSKFTHLNDGCLDLVLVKETPRKEFIRLVKRLGNAKNQFDFPFIEWLRVRQVRFRIRLPTGFKYNANDFSEIDYEMERQKTQNESLSKSMEILEIDNLSEDDGDDDSNSTPIPSRASPEIKPSKEKPPLKKSKSFQPGMKKELKRTNTETLIRTINTEDTDSDVDDLDDDDDDDDDGEGSQEPNEIVSVTNGVRTVRPAAVTQNLVGPQYRMTFAEQDRAKRRKRQLKKEEKKKLREEQKMKSVWNIDNELKAADHLEIKVHHGLLRVYGRGISPDTSCTDSSLLCIPRI